jgi:AraC-like DNA-binding protein
VDDAPAIRLRECFYREADPDWYVGDHHHDVHQWYICVHGTMRVRVDADIHELSPERSLIVLPGATRELVMGRRAPGYVVALFTPQALDLTAIIGRPQTLPAALRDDLHALVEELRRPGEDSRLLVRTLLVRLLIGHKRVAAAPAAPVSGLNAASHEAVVRAADAFLIANLSRQVRRSEVAAAVHLSEPHLARLYRATTGHTIVQRLTELRIQQAKSLLLESTLSVAQVAGEVGIISFSHFARIFKRAVGISPGDYRRSGGTSYR